MAEPAAISPAAGRGTRMSWLRRLLRDYPTEVKLFAVLLAICVGLSLATDSFLTPANLSSLLNNNSVNLIWAVGLLVVLVAGGIDISFAVAASVVQYLAVFVLGWLGGGNWAIGFAVAIVLGAALGFINAALIHWFRIITIVVTIATFNAFFGLLMYFSEGKFIYDLPSWWTGRIFVWERQMESGAWAELNLTFGVMVVCCFLTWLLLRHTTTGRQLYAFGDNPEGARRVGISAGAMTFIAFGWCGAMAGIAGLMQVNITREVVPNALIGRELDVLAAVVLGGARLGGGRGSVIGCVLGVLLVAVTQNGLNLLGVSPYAFKMVIGAIILVAISTSGLALVSGKRRAAP